MKPQVVCLPGGVAPAAQRYAPLKPLVETEAELYVKDLEVYREAAPPSNYSVEFELAAVDAFADANGLERFHLLGYSGGGFLSLAYAGTRQSRVKSVAVFEPASIPGQMSREEREIFDALEAKLRGLNGPAFVETFIREQLKPGVPMPPPPPGPPSPEMQKRPAGLAAMLGAFNSYEFDRSSFMQCAFPLFISYGELTHAVESIRAGLLARLFVDVRVRRYAGIHHFVPPEMIYTPEYARSLRDHWRRGDELSPEFAKQ